MSENNYDKINENLYLDSYHDLFHTLFKYHEIQSIGIMEL